MNYYILETHIIGNESYEVCALKEEQKKEIEMKISVLEKKGKFPIIRESSTNQRCLHITKDDYKFIKCTEENYKFIKENFKKNTTLLRHLNWEYDRLNDIINNPYYYSLKVESPIGTKYDLYGYQISVLTEEEKVRIENKLESLRNLHVFPLEIKTPYGIMTINSFDFKIKFIDYNFYRFMKDMEVMNNYSPLDYVMNYEIIQDDNLES